MSTSAVQKYADYSLTELYEALSSIQHETYPESFAALVAEIDTRTFSSMTELEDCYFKLNREKWPEYGQKLWEQIESSGGFTVLADEVITDENKYRNVWRRIFAGFIDSLILGVVALVMINVATVMLAEIPGLLPYVELALQYVGIAYYIFLHGLYGQTVGKMMTGVKIIDVSEVKPITYWQATLREIVPLSTGIVLMTYVLILTAVDIRTEPSPLEILIVFWLFILAVGWIIAEFVTMIFGKKHRAVQDYIARTVVVRSTWSELQESLGTIDKKHRDD